MNEHLGERAARTSRCRVGLSFEYDLWRPHQAWFVELTNARAYGHVLVGRWSTDAQSLDHLSGAMLRSGRYVWGAAAIVELAIGGGVIAQVTLDDGLVWACVAGHTADEVRAGREALEGELPAIVADGRQQVPVTFWVLGSYAESSVRAIDVPTWADVAGNYPEDVRAGLEPLMTGFQPGPEGRLVLWHGEPGTGKTYALRALAWEWRSWCDVHYVVDPEVFFGSSPAYMVSVMLDETDDRWRLLVLEDTGELLAADAKQRVGQGLSRLLNTVDGLIGEGLRLLVLITTNDELRQLHPAVIRPGRCAARVHFRGFTAAESADWLERNGVEGRPRAATLAGLFATADGTVAEVRKPFGFGFGA